MSITAAIEQEFRTWLDFLNDIRDIGIDEDFGIPQVAVIGDQVRNFYIANSVAFFFFF
jgi:hypothetical protein